MTIDLALNRLKELHDAIKEHPYLINFEFLNHYFYFVFVNLII